MGGGRGWVLLGRPIGGHGGKVRSGNDSKFESKCLDEIGAPISWWVAIIVEICGVGQHGESEFWTVVGMAVETRGYSLKDCFK